MGSILKCGMFRLGQGSITLLTARNLSSSNFNVHRYHQRKSAAAVVPRSLPVSSGVRGMSSGSHVTLWTAERILSGVLVPVLPLALITPCAPLDYILAFTLVLHSHWGIEAIVVDYVRPSVFGQVIPKLAVALVYGLSAMTLGGLFYFTYSDVGLGNAVRMLWKL